MEPILIGPQCRACSSTIAFASFAAILALSSALVAKPSVTGNCFFFFSEHFNQVLFLFYVKFGYFLKFWYFIAKWGIFIWNSNPLFRCYGNFGAFPYLSNGLFVIFWFLPDFTLSKLPDLGIAHAVFIFIYSLVGISWVSLAFYTEHNVS